MKYLVTVAGTEYEVVVDAGKVTVNGQPITLDQKSLHQWVVDGHNTYIDRVSARLVNVENHLYEVSVVPVLPIKRPEGADDHQGLAVVKAAMPGKILRVPVNVGDTVEPNQLIFTLEAMKMENEVLAPIGGTIKEIHKSPADTVEADEPVLVIEN